MNQHRPRLNSIIPLLALALLLLPDVLWASRAEEFSYAIQHGLAFTLCLTLGCLAWSQRRLGILLLLGLPFALLVPLECYYIWRYSFPSSAHVLAIIGETNFREAIEYVGYPLAGALVLCMALIGLLYLHSIYRLGLRPTYPPHRIWIWVGIAMLLPFLSLSGTELALNSIEEVDQFGGSPSPPSDIASTQDNSQSVLTRSLLKDVRFRMDEVITSSFPFGVPFRFSTYLSEQRRLDEAREKSKKIHISANTPANAPSELLVLVIGESAQPGHWHANGYPHPTTPEIEKIANAVSLGNVVSPWPATRQAVPSMLTGLIDKNGLPPVAEPSIIDVFRAAGWQTYWLSNQSPLGMHDSTIVLQADRAQYRHFLNGADYSQAADYDEVLLPALDDALKTDRSQRKLIILHLLGSHGLYENRYPKAFAKFDGTISHDDPKVGGFAPMHEVYDNTILYTDYILSQVIKRLQQENKVSALVYASDHGQNLPDLECSKFGHGHSTVDSFKIAALAWLSPEFEKDFPQSLQRLEAKKSAPLHQRDIFHTLIDMAGIEYDGLNTSRSWINKNWHQGPRPVGVLADFDSATITGACQTVSAAPQESTSQQ